MPCFNPLQGYRSRTLNASGKRSIVFKPQEGYYDQPITVPCGQCIGCRLERSRQWAIRCMHEAELYDNNCFITLTYAPDCIPDDSTLVKAHFTNFMKRLRKRYGQGIRYFHCGEYGECFQRPHYHACLFNFDFADKELLKVNTGYELYTSKSLKELWPFGFSTIGAVNFETAAYVARYITKKITGKNANEHYVNKVTGVLREPEYVTMSRGCKKLHTGGIGSGWYEKFTTDIYPADSVIVHEREVRPPKYYDSKFDIDFPDEMIKIKNKRKKILKKFDKNVTPVKLRERERAAIKKLKNSNQRRFEND